MRKRLLTFFGCVGLVVCLGVSEAEADQPLVRRVRVYGSDRFRRETLVEVLGIRDGKVLPVGWPRVSMENLLSWYYGQGYLLVQKKSPF